MPPVDDAPGFTPVRGPERVPVANGDARVPLLAEIHLSHSELPLADTIRAAPAATVRLEYETRAAGAGGGDGAEGADGTGRRSFLSVSADDYHDFESALLADHTVADPQVVAAFPDHRIYRVVVLTDLELVPSRAAALGARTLAVRAGGDGWIVRLRLFARDALDAFRAYCLDHGVTYQVRELSRASSRTAEYAFGLTESQRATLLLAYETGYFDVPRRVSQDDLAGRLGVSTSAVSQRLRRATARLVAATVAADDDADAGADRGGESGGDEGGR